jgi:hypothetical protein
VAENVLDFEDQQEEELESAKEYFDAKKEEMLAFVN